MAGSWSITSQPAGNPCSINAGVLQCAFSDLGSGEARSVEIEALTDFAQCETLVNKATAASTNSPNATGEATIECRKPDLRIVKTGNGPVSAGQDVQFSIGVSNQGPGVAKSVALTDELPDGVAGPWTVLSSSGGNCDIVDGKLGCVLGDLQPGANASVTVKAPTDKTACETYQNNAQVISTNGPSASAAGRVHRNR